MPEQTLQPRPGAPGAQSRATLVNRLIDHAAMVRNDLLEDRTGSLAHLLADAAQVVRATTGQFDRDNLEALAGELKPKNEDEEFDRYPWSTISRQRTALEMIEILISNALEGEA